MTSTETAVRCESLDLRLASSCGVGATLDSELEAHVRGCLRCQAERIRYRRLHHGLAAVASTEVPPPDDLVIGILRELDDSLAMRRRGRRAMCTVAAAAGAAGAIALVGRAHARRLAG